MLSSLRAALARASPRPSTLGRMLPRSSSTVAPATTAASSSSSSSNRLWAILLAGLGAGLAMKLRQEQQESPRVVHAWSVADRVEIEKILGEAGALVDASGKPRSVKDLQGKTLGIYFSALWCNPCMQFSPILRMFYQACNKSTTPLEVVFVSCDLTDGQHAAYIKHIHDLWLHVPYANQKVMGELKKATGCWAGPKDAEVLGRIHHKVGIPTLILYHPDSPQVIQNGTDVVRNWYTNAVAEQRSRG
eukprot:RCo015317